MVAINAFDSDHPEEIEAVKRISVEAGALGAAATYHWQKGGEGAVELAEMVVEAAETPSEFNFLYELDQPIKDKIETIATKIYGAKEVSYTPKASKQIRSYEKNGFGGLPICMAKTHLSISHDPSLRGAPSGFTFPVREVRASVGAGFIYPICGAMRTMPALPKVPGAEKIDIDADGNIVGLS